MGEEKKEVGRPRTRPEGLKRLRLSVYVDPPTERALRMAAVLQNQSLIEFVTNASTERARQVLGEHGLNVAE